MQDPSDVTLIFHSVAGRAASTTISVANRQYLTTNPEGKTPGEATAFYLGKLKNHNIDHLQIWSCHSAERSNYSCMNLVSFFYHNFTIKYVQGVIGPLNFYNPWHPLHLFKPSYAPKADVAFATICHY